jgi:hypothetical protein
MGLILALQLDLVGSYRRVLGTETQKRLMRIGSGKEISRILS